MIADKLLIMSDAQALTASANSGAIDTGKAGDAETSLWVRSTVRKTFTGLTSLKEDIVTSDTADFAVKTVLLSSGVVPLAQLSAGAPLINARLPLGCKRHIRAEYTVAGTGTGGSVDTLLVKDTENANAIADAQAV